MGGNSAIYFIVDNPSAQEDVLLSASSDGAEAVELHLSKMDSEGTMKMQQQDSVPIPAKSKVELKPGGLHIMLIKLKSDLKAGDTISLILKFHHAGEIKLEVPVRQP
jgi:copper(I)-binding protein